MKLVKTREHSDSANLRQGQTLTGDCLSRRKHIVSEFDLEACSKVVEDVTIGQNTYDFLLVFCSNLDRISYCLCATVDFMLK